MRTRLFIALMMLFSILGVNLEAQDAEELAAIEIPRGEEELPSMEEYKSQLVHIMPMMGIGEMIVDTDFMTSLMEGEVPVYHHILHPEEEGADYIIMGVTSLYIPEEDADMYEGEYIVNLQLIDAHTDELIVEQNALYDTIETFLEQFDQLMRNIFLSIPPLPPDAEDVYDDERWRNKILYVDGRGVWAPKQYTYSKQISSVSPSAFGVSAAVEWQFLNFMAAELVAELNMDWVLISYSFEDLHLQYSLSLPLMIKYVFKPRNITNLMLEVEAGAQLNLPLQRHENIMSSLLSVTGGVQVDTKVGEGAIFTDVRVAYDLFDGRAMSLPGLPGALDKVYLYTRWTLHIGIGYKYGFFDRKKKAAPSGTPVPMAQ